MTQLRIANAGALLALLATASALAVRVSAPPAQAGTTPPVVVAAGDIACDPHDPAFGAGQGTTSSCAARRTAKIAERIAPDAVLALGDEQYENGRLWKFRRSYGASWGRLQTITWPAVGNHEYETKDAAGYFDYFDGAGDLDGPAGIRGEGWYSFDLGDWHLISLNANCGIVDCTDTSPQVLWLQNDLALHSASQCVLAFWHQPRFSSGHHGNDHDVKPFWDALYAAGADVVLNGHDHDYEQFLPQTPSGVADPSFGIGEFVVGTGGKSRRGFTHHPANSFRRDARDFGVLKLTLLTGRYRWRFATVGHSAFADTGSRACHGAPPPPVP
jgi:hypothetical protein